MTFRSPTANEGFIVCTQCGVLTAVTMEIAHNRSHRLYERKTPSYNRATVADLIKLLNQFDSSSEIELDVLGYEWEEASLNLIVSDKLKIPLITV